jgi:hypothetical protein
LSRKSSYNIGDIFELDLGEDGLGAGRILKIGKPSIFIELFNVNPKHPIDMSLLETAERILSIWSVETGLKKGIWRILGNIPVVGEIKMPDFWKRDALDPNKIILLREDKSFEINTDQIGKAQPYGIFGHDAVKIRYSYELKKRGIM